MGKVVQLSEHRQGPYPKAFEDVWDAYPHVTSRKSKGLALKAWKLAIREADCTEDQMLVAVQLFASDPQAVKDRKDCGAPAMERWFKWGRHEHWLSAGVAPSQTPSPGKQEKIFPDETLRKSFHLRFQRWPKAVAWFDRCGWDGEAREITKAPPARKDWLQKAFYPWAKLNDVRAIQKVDVIG